MSNISYFSRARIVLRSSRVEEVNPNQHGRRSSDLESKYFENTKRRYDTDQILKVLEQINIRLATSDDIPALRELIPQSVRALSSSYYSKQQIESALTHIFGVDTQLIKDGTYYVAESVDQVVAAGGWSKRATLFGGDQLKQEALDPLLNPASDAARIRAFYVHPDWSRRGLARKILQQCEAAAKLTGFKRIELVATLPGEPLYTTLGYTRCEPVSLNTPDGESLPAFRMEKLL
ncbi:MAG TPA: GNAT family N-acetyltransferase [Pyrinomonadaceae bacterium]|nr:GNAT family N-acetyltransferase [Pyrinomonadaceae bacterium]